MLVSIEVLVYQKFNSKYWKIHAKVTHKSFFTRKITTEYASYSYVFVNYDAYINNQPWFTSGHYKGESNKYVSETECRLLETAFIDYLSNQ